MALSLADEGARDFLALVKLAVEDEDQLAGRLIGDLTPIETVYALAAGSAIMAQLLVLVMGEDGAARWIADRLTDYAVHP